MKEENKAIHALSNQSATVNGELIERLQRSWGKLCSDYLYAINTTTNQREVDFIRGKKFAMELAMEELESEFKGNGFNPMKEMQIISLANAMYYNRDEAVRFAQWIADNEWSHHDNNRGWTEYPYNEYKTTAELYALFQESETKK